MSNSNSSNVPLVDPARSYVLVSYLPDEMIRYELETQGLRSDRSLGKRRAQLANLFRNNLYCLHKQPVAMGYQEDINQCESYVDQWAEGVQNSIHLPGLSESYIIKHEFLERRTLAIQVPSLDAAASSQLLNLKAEISKILLSLKFRSMIANVTLAATAASSQRERLENWSMEDSASHDGTSHHPSPIIPPRDEQMRNSTQRIRFSNTPALPIIPHQTALCDETLRLFNDSYDRYARESAYPRRSSCMLTSEELVEDPLPHSIQRPSVTRPITTRREPSVPETHVQNSDPYNSQLPRLPPNPSLPPTSSKRAQIWKWGLKFTGDKDGLSVVEFLQRVRELAQGRGASPQELLESASDLFGGSALKWYRAGIASRQFTTWAQVEDQLLTDYEAYDYADNLLEYIKNRLQRPSERIVSYFAVMEDLFLKLNRPISEDFKMKIIRRNLRAEYIKGIGFTQFLSVNDLKDGCKVLESDFRRIMSRNILSSSHREPDSGQKNVRFSERIASIEDLSGPDFSRYERTYDAPHESLFKTRKTVSELNSFRNRSPSPYRSSSLDRSFDRRMQALAVREEPNRLFIPVPNPSRDNSNAPRCLPEPPNHKSYYAPVRAEYRPPSSQRDAHPHPTSVPQGNDSGRSAERTPTNPRIMKRPY